MLDALLAETGKPAWLLTREEPTSARVFYEQGGWRPVGTARTRRTAVPASCCYTAED